MNENYLVEEFSACEESVTEPLVSELRKKKKSKLQKAREGKVFKWVNGALMALFALFCLYPFVNVVLTSFASFGDYVNSNGLVIPYHFTFGAYSYMFSIGRIPKGFLITFCISFIGAIVNVVMVSLAAYPLTKSDLPGKKIISFFIVFTMFFGGGLIPQYLIIRGLGFVNKNFSSLFGLVLPFCLNAFNIIILRNFFRTVPESVIESAEIDGAGEFRILFQFVMPLAMSGIVTIALFSVVGYWNDWFWPMLIVRNTEYYTLALVLRELLAQPVQPGVGSPPPDSQLLTEASEAAAIVISILPLIIIYPFVQKFFEKGIILGAVKG